MSTKNIDVINITGGNSGGHCGYCNKVSNIRSSYGITCDKMRPETYLNLINRGWRRCGTYYYKAFNDVTCCSLYPIRCNAKDFKLSKSQKKVLKRMEHYLMHGKAAKVQIVNAGGDTNSSNVSSGLKMEKSCTKFVSTVSRKNDKSKKAKTIRYNLKLDKLKTLATNQNKSFECLLAEYTQRRFQRLQKNKPKQLHDYLNYSNMKESKHSLKLKIVRCFPDSKQFTDTIEQEHQVYEKYQCAVHNDKPNEVTISQFKRFLVKGGLSSSSSPEVIDLSRGEFCLPQGQYHQQYWLDDDQLIAVGVIDILPSGISSVYLFYDPSFGFLNLGTYSALTEINLVNQLRTNCDDDDFSYLYMGFYVHSCAKMQYKAQFRPSFIACPITFEWVPADLCQRVLDSIKYGRFSVNESRDSLSLDSMTFKEISDLITVVVAGKKYKLSKIKGSITPSLLNELEQVAKLFGSKVLNSIQIGL